MAQFLLTENFCAITLHCDYSATKDNEYCIMYNICQISPHLETTNGTEWEEAENHWTDDAAIRNRAKTIARVPRI